MGVDYNYSPFPTTKEVKEMMIRGYTENEICDTLSKRYNMSNPVTDKLIRPCVKEIMNMK